MQDRHDEENYRRLFDLMKFWQGVQILVHHSFGENADEKIAKSVVPAVLVLSGLCTVTIALADATTPLHQKSGYDRFLM